MIFSTLDQLAFPCDIGDLGLLGDWPACYFKVPNQHTALFGLGRSWGLARIPVSGRQNGRRISGGPRGVCAVASGLLLSVICGLHRGPWGRGLGFLWGHRGSGVCLGSWGGRYALGTSLCSGCHGRGRGPFRQRGRPPDTPTCLRAQPASSGRNGFFRTPAICSGAPGKKSFHDSLKSYSFLLCLSPGQLSTTREVTLFRRF